MTTRDWARLGRAVRAAREARGMTQQQFAGDSHGGISRTTLQKLERGEPLERRVGAVLTAVEGVLGWAEGSAESVLAGEDPLPLPQSEEPSRAEAELRQAATDPLADKLPLTVAVALEDGLPVESAVIDTVDGARYVMVRVRARGAPALTPEERRREAAHWQRVIDAIAKPYEEDEA